MEHVKILYVVLQDQPPCGRSSRYSQLSLQLVLHFAGCKPHHALEVSNEVFKALVYMVDTDNNMGKHTLPQFPFPDTIGANRYGLALKVLLQKVSCSGDCYISKTQGNRILLHMRRESFLDVVFTVLAIHGYSAPSQQTDILIACRIQERRESITILLCGASGSGKSTLSSLLASRLGITTVVSTDSIRNTIRSFVDEKMNPLLWASSYDAVDFIDHEAILKAKLKKSKRWNATSLPFQEIVCHCNGRRLVPVGTHICAKYYRTLVVSAFKAHCEMVIGSLDELIRCWEQTSQSAIVEGVHLSLSFVVELMEKHPSIMPFVIYIANEKTHVERFSVRAKYMALQPTKNRYIKHIQSIRTIQDYLCRRADKYCVPKVNNTNVDRSIALLHATILRCLEKRQTGTPFFDQHTRSAKLVNEEYQNQLEASYIGSKCMFYYLERRGSSHVKNSGGLAHKFDVNGCGEKLEEESEETRGSDDRVASGSEEEIEETRCTDDDQDDKHYEVDASSVDDCRMEEV